MNVGIIQGSDSGDTEDVMEYIEKKLSKYKVENIHVENASLDDFTRFDILLLGISTCYGWYNTGWLWVALICFWPLGVYGIFKRYF